MSPATKLAVPSVPAERFTLTCGATLLVSPRPGAPVCAVQAHLRGGHSLDPKGQEGVAWLTGALVDQGTKNHTEEDFAAALENAGGALSGGSTGLSGHMAGDRWKVLLELFCEGLTAPTYPRSKFERQRQRLLDRLLVEKDDPRLQAARRFRKMVYGNHWMGRAEHGTFESVARLKRADVAAHHRREWCGERTVLAFCGDVDPQAVRRFLDRRLKGWKRGADLKGPDLRFPARERRTAAVPADRQQVHVYLGHLGIRRSDPDYAALAVMDHVLGTGPGFTNRISRKLRDEQGLAYTVHAAIHSSAGVLPGTFTAYIGTSPEHLRTAVEGFLREIRLIQEKLVSKDELELAKSYLTGSLALGYERASRRVQSLVSAHRVGLPENYLEELATSFASVTRADVRRVAREHLHPERSSLVVGGPVTAKAVDALL